MALMKTGITPETYKRLLYDQGVLIANYGLVGQRILGATGTNNKLDIKQEMRQMKYAGAPGPVKGDKRLVGSEIKLTANLMEVSTANLLLGLPGFASAANATHDVLTSIRQINDGDYFENVALVLQKAATAVDWIIILKNVLASGELSLDFKEKEECAIPIEFTAHFAPNALGTLPIEIWNPFEAASGFHTLTYVAGANGQILGLSTQIIQNGEDGAPVVAYADPGYVFSAWSDAHATADRTDTNVTADHVFTATFAAA